MSGFCLIPIFAWITLFGAAQFAGGALTHVFLGCPKDHPSEVIGWTGFVIAMAGAAVLLVVGLIELA